MTNRKQGLNKNGGITMLKEGDVVTFKWRIEKNKWLYQSGAIIKRIILPCSGQFYSNERLFEISDNSQGLFWEHELNKKQSDCGKYVFCKIDIPEGRSAIIIDDIGNIIE